MTEAEFSQWIGYHGKLFVGFADWWRRMEPEAVAEWMRALSTVGLEPAKTASRELLSGDLEADGGYTSHLRTIRTRAQTLCAARGTSTAGPAYSDGQEVFSCRICFDSGTVSIWRPEVMADAIAGLTPHPKTCLAACSCQAGDRFSETNHGVGAWAKVCLPRYEEGAEYPFIDPAKRTRRTACMALACEGSIEEQLQSIAAAAETFDRIEERSNFSPELAAFNE